MDFETGFILSVLRAERAAYLAVVQQGFTADLIIDEKRREAWAWITAYDMEYGAFPPAQEVQRRFAFLFQGDETPAAPEFYLQELRSRRIFFRVKDASLEATRLLKDSDPRGALAVLERMVVSAQADTRSAQDLNLRQSPDMRIDEYRQTKAMEGLLGFPTPWPTLNRWTLGFRPGELIVISSRPGIGKSWLLTLLSREVHTTTKKVPLIVSREMAATQFARRIDAAQAKVPYSGLRAGDLSQEQEDRFVASARAFADMPDFWISSDDSAMGVAGLAAKVDQLKPDILFLDGMYLMRDDQGESGWEGITNLTRDLKRLAVRKQIPIVVTTQLNRKSKGLRADLSALSYSDSIGQDADLVLGLLQTDEMRDNYELMIRLLKQREGLTGEFKVRWDLETMNFGELAEDTSTPDADDGSFDNDAMSEVIFD